MKVYLFFIAAVILLSCSNQIVRDSNDIIDFSGINKDHLDTNQINQLALKYFLEGTKLHNQKKYEKAVIEFMDALRFDSSYAVHYAIAKSFKELRRYELAEKHLLIAVKQKSDFIEGLELLAEIQFLQGFINNNENLEKAIITMKKVVELNPSDKNLFMLARIYEYSDINQSLKLYNRLLKSNQSLMVLNRLLEIYEKNDSTEKYYNLIEKYDDKLLNAPSDFNDIFSYYYTKKQTDKIKNIVQLADKKLNIQENAEFLARAITLILEYKNSIFKETANYLITQNNANYISYYSYQFVLGILYYNLDDIDQSVSSFDKAIRFAPEFEDITEQVAYFYYSNKEYKKSILFLNKIIDKNPKISSLLFLSQIYSYDLSDEEKGLDYAHQAYEQDSNNVDVLINLANIFSNKENFTKSDFYYEKALTIDSTDALINNNFAFSLANRKKDLDKAVKMSKIAIEKEPNNSAFLDTYGWILFKQGKYKEAALYLEEATNKNDVTAEVFEHLGDIYIELNRYEEALDAYEDALKMSDNNFILLKKIEQIKDEILKKD